MIRRFVLFLLCLFAWGCSTYHFEKSFPLPETENEWQPHGIPILRRSAYSVCYDGKNRNPCWVYQDLTQENIQGEESREGLEFRYDEELPSHLRAMPEDYVGSGYDRGHMAPAADCRSSQDELSESFYLTNVCPQNSQLNRGYWKRLEKQARDLTKTHAHVYVVTGPLYLPKKERDGKRYIKYQVIGKNDVAVPTHFYKVIYLEKRPGVVETLAYIVPNTAVGAEIPIEKYQVSLDKIEQSTGLVFRSSSR